MKGKLRNGRRARPDQGIDLPPPLLYSELSADVQPLHHLCTLSAELEGSSTCPPIILFHRFIATLSYAGVLKLYTLRSAWIHQSPRTLIPPTLKLPLVEDDSSHVVAMAELDGTKVNEKILGTIIVATCQGRIFLVEVDSDCNTAPRLVHTVDTNILNVASITGWITDNEISIVVGAKSGCIEEWKVVVHDSTDGPPTPALIHHLVWRGSFHTFLHSLMAIRTTLSVCISQTSHMVPKIHSSSVEVLDRSKLAQAWKEKDETLELAHFCIWPNEGHEWVRATTDQSPKQDVALGSNVMFRINHSSWAMALADGSVGVLNTFPPSASSSTVGWGLTSDSLQATLQYPAIGLGELELDGNPHLACCLRGGTVYCLPLLRSSKQHNYPAFVPPADDEEDFSFIHGFAAGNVYFEDSEDRSSSFINKKPVILYAGDGGMIEVYLCGLQIQRNLDVVHQSTLQKMADNGTIQLFLNGIKAMKHGDRLLKHETWSLAHEECHVSEVTVEALLTNKSNVFVHTRALLLNLAQ